MVTVSQKHLETLKDSRETWQLLHSPFRQIGSCVWIAAAETDHRTMTNLHNLVIVPGSLLENSEVIEITFSTSLALPALKSEIRLIYIKRGGISCT